MRAIEFILEVRQKVTNHLLIEETIILTDDGQNPYRKSWTCYDNYNHVGIVYSVKNLIQGLLESALKNIHVAQALNAKEIESLRKVDWTLDLCIVEVKRFDRMSHLYEWYKQNSVSKYNSHLN